MDLKIRSKKRLCEWTLLTKIVILLPIESTLVGG